MVLYHTRFGMSKGDYIMDKNIAKVFKLASEAETPIIETEQVLSTFSLLLDSYNDEFAVDEAHESPELVARSTKYLEAFSQIYNNVHDATKALDGTIKKLYEWCRERGDNDSDEEKTEGDKTHEGYEYEIMRYELNHISNLLILAKQHNDTCNTAADEDWETKTLLGAAINHTTGAITRLENRHKRSQERK